MLPATGEDGATLTVTGVVPAAPAHPPTVTLTEYVPATAVVIAEMTGSSELEEKPFGPVQLYVAPAIVFAVKLRSYPVQTGLLLPAEGVAGGGLIVTLTVPAGPVQPATVAVTE